jgi:hypothetical protein
MVCFAQVSLQQVLLTAFEQAVGPFVKRMGRRRRAGQVKNCLDDFLKFP